MLEMELDRNENKKDDDKKNLFKLDDKSKETQKALEQVKELGECLKKSLDYE